MGKTCLLREYRVLALEAGLVTVRREFTQRFQDEATFAVTFLSDLQDAVEELSGFEALKGKAGRLLATAREFVGALTLKYQELEFSLQRGEGNLGRGLL